MSLGQRWASLFGRLPLYQGTVVLAVASVTSRLLGLAYRIPLARLIGDEGFGLYTAGYSLYALILALSTSGVNVAVSKLVAEKTAAGDEVAADRTFRISLVLLLLTGLVAAVGVALAAAFLVDVSVHDPRAYYSVIALAPALFLVALETAYRGYFQGRRLMAASGLSQVIEQVARVAFALGLAYLLLPRGLAFAAGGAAAGAAIGALFGLVWLRSAYLKAVGRKPGKAASFRLRLRLGPWAAVRRTALRVLALAIPVSVAGLAVALMGVVDTFLVPARLQGLGLSVERSIALYGQLSGWPGRSFQSPHCCPQDCR